MVFNKVVTYQSNLAFDPFFLSCTLADSPTRDLQNKGVLMRNTVFMCFATNNILLIGTASHADVWRMAELDDRLINQILNSVIANVMLCQFLAEAFNSWKDHTMYHNHYGEPNLQDTFLWIYFFSFSFAQVSIGKIYQALETLEDSTKVLRFVSYFLQLSSLCFEMCLNIVFRVWCIACNVPLSANSIQFNNALSPLCLAANAE